MHNFYKGVRSWAFRLYPPQTGGGVNDKKELFKEIYPVGSIYMSVNNINPGTLFGGTWVSFGTGKTLVGVDTSDSSFNTVEKTGGEKAHTLALTEIPSHNHGRAGGTGRIEPYFLGRISNQDNLVNATGIFTAVKANDGANRTIASNSNTKIIGGGRYDRIDINTAHTHTSNGGGGSHNNLQPYITCYMWKRTA